MDIDESKIGDWPNVALVPGTHIHAATGEHVEQPENTRIWHPRGACRPDDADCEHEPADVENGAQDGSEWIITINEDTMRVLSDVCREQSKKQLRAEAAERVKNCRYDTTADLVREMVNWGHEPHTGEELRHALIDLLTDDDSGTMETETSQVPEHDTREQLEADIRRAYWCLSEQEIEPVFGWLNRQAAITRRETRQSWQDAPNVLDRTNLQTIAELTAERDNWANCYDSAVKRGQNLLSKIDELTAERDSLREKNSNQRRQLSELQDAIHSRNEGELKRQWKQQIDELTAERDELRKERDRWHVEQVHAYGNWEDVHEYAKKLEAERDELKAEVEAQRKRANDAERGVLSEEWYVSRDRYEDDIAELKAERDKLQERFLAVYDIKNERDRLKDVVQKQADSFAKMERELHDAKVEAKHSRDGVERLTEKCQTQREELAKLNAEKRGTRKLPKKVVWPRDEKGKPVTLNALGAKNILFDSRTYLIEYWDGSTRYETYKQAKEALNAMEG